MSEIERMQRYIASTGTEDGETDAYCMRLPELSALVSLGSGSANRVYRAIDLAFMYGKAKGYRAAQAKARRA